MELLDLYDNNGKLLNKTIVRGNKNFEENENIKLATIWIKSNNKYLIQKTSKEKGGEYAVSGGHVQAGLTSKQQARLELEEELALKISENDLQFLGNIYGPHRIFDVYAVENNNFDKLNFTLQEEEVESVVWLTADEIDHLISKDAVRKSTVEQFNKFIKSNVQTPCGTEKRLNQLWFSLFLQYHYCFKPASVSIFSSNFFKDA